jgi:lysophospholipase L1-like esterase
MVIHPDDTILFTGDSITDCGRVRDDAKNLGFGYAAFAAAQLQLLSASPELKIFNRGISGNRVRDLLGRVQADLLDLKPDIVSILIGINDTWRRYDAAQSATTAAEFERDYRALLEKIRGELDAQVILLEPFLLHVPDDRHAWREDLNPKIDVVRKLAVEFETELIPLDGIFAEAATTAPAAFWAHDGVHPTAAGHALIADAWIERAEVE